MIETLLLGHLYDNGPLTSYSLKAKMECSTEFFHNTSFGTLHPALTKLAEEGYVTTMDQTVGKRFKKYYAITDKGRQRFHELIRQKTGPDKLKICQMVKLFFFDKLSPEEQQDSIDAYIKTLEETIDKLHAIEAEAKLSLAAHGLTFETYPAIQYQMDTLHFGLAYHGFIKDWFEKHKITLKERHSNENQHL